MRGPVFIYIDCLNLHLPHRNLLTRTLEQHIHLIFVALPLNLRKSVCSFSVKCPQPCLRIVHLHPRCKPVDDAGHRIPKPASERDIPFHFPASQDELSRIFHSRCAHFLHVIRFVLPIRIDRHYDII